MLKSVLTNSALRVILTLLVGLFIGLKAPEGVKLICTISEVLAVHIEQCYR